MLMFDAAITVNLMTYTYTCVWMNDENDETLLMGCKWCYDATVSLFELNPSTSCSAIPLNFNALGLKPLHPYNDNDRIDGNAIIINE
jgi:hypothetical protein